MKMGDRGVAILMTCHNRKTETLGCLAAIAANDLTGLTVKIFLVDAGSTDGTASIDKELPLDIVLIPASDRIYWNAGMRIAWKAALLYSPAFYLWLNDDVFLTKSALKHLVDEYDEQILFNPTGRVIVVGKILNSSGAAIYGGYKRATRLSRLNWRRLQVGEKYCDTFNGNCVLIPSSAASEVGINSSHFSHGFGDIDYGLRARAAGYSLIEAQTPIGENRGALSCKSRRPFSVKALVELATTPKEIPFWEWLYFCRAHGGALWPFNFLKRYLSAFVEI